MTKQSLMRTLAVLALAAGASGCASAQMHEFADDALAAPGVAYNAAQRALGCRLNI
jgi:hypothetical protein